jgi:phosphatidate cytidylyltransferase
MRRANAGLVKPVNRWGQFDMWLRIASAAVLAPLFLLALFKLPVTGVLVLIGLLLAGVVWEASSLAGMKAPGIRILYTASVAGAGSAGFLFVGKIPELSKWVIYLSGLACLWWIVHIPLLARFSVSTPGTYGSVSGRASNSAFVLLTTWFAIVAILLQDNREPMLLVYILVMIWIADSGAYFAGKFLGKHKLAPRVSPGKTIEGVAGGLAAVAVYALLCGSLVFDLQGARLLEWLLLALVVSAVSVVGDLNESAIKRAVGKKDSGSIIPGHGGLFDRVDAITAAVPVFYFGLVQANRGVLL